jgi:hypothetical protein
MHVPDGRSGRGTIQHTFVLLGAMTLTLCSGSVLADPIPTVTEVFLKDLWLDGFEQISCAIAGPITAQRETEGHAVCFGFSPERAIGTRTAPWDAMDT